MGMSIRTNVGSLNAQRNLYSTQNSLNTSLAKLSSGFRITKAGDDAAGLAISEVLRSQISGLNQASKNAQDAISMIQTAEGAMQEVHSMLQRMNQLAMQASNATLSDKNRGLIKLELDQLHTEINSIAGRVNFNGQKLLDGSLSTAIDSTSTINAGTAAGADAGVIAVDVSRAKTGLTFTFTDNTDGTVTLDDGTGNSQTINFAAAIAAGGNATLDFSTLGVKISLGSAVGSSAADAAAGLDGETIVTAAGGGAATFQIGPNATDTLSINFDSIEIDAGSSTASFAALAGAIAGWSDADPTTANALVTAIADTINDVSKMRANLGAAQNRLDHTIENINVTSENLSASESRIRDADVANETAEMTKAQILMQAGVSVLAQANQMPQMTLKLLG